MVDSGLWLCSVQFAVLGYVMHLLVRHPFQKIATDFHEGRNNDESQSRPVIPPPLQRKWSKAELQVICRDRIFADPLLFLQTSSWYSLTIRSGPG